MLSRLCVSSPYCVRIHRARPAKACSDEHRAAPGDRKGRRLRSVPTRHRGQTATEDQLALYKFKRFDATEGDLRCRAGFCTLRRLLDADGVGGNDQRQLTNLLVVPEGAITAMKHGRQDRMQLKMWTFRHLGLHKIITCSDAFT